VATTAYLKYHNGKLDVPEELQREWHLHDGDSVEVSRLPVRERSFLNELSKNPKEIDWRLFEGVLADAQVDLNAELEKERIRDNERDACL
jgi:hypothetical protein